MRSKIVLVSLIAAFVSMMGACSSKTETVPKGAAGESSAPKEMPKIVLYGDNAQITSKPEGSNPQWLKEVQDYIRKQAEVDVTVILPPSDNASAQTKLNLMLSSSEKVDVWLGDWTLYRYAIMPINDLLDKFGPDIKKAYSAEDWKLVTDNDGKIWGIPRSTSVVTFPVYVRSDWLKKVNLPMPQTIDELETVLKAFKEQIPDSIPLMAENVNQQNLRKTFLGGYTKYGDSNWLDPADGKLKIAEQDPGFKDFLAKMADWYQKGYIYKDAFGKVDHLQVIKTGKIGVEANWFSRVTLQSPQAQIAFPDMEYEIAYNLKGPKGIVQTVNPGNTLAYVINKKSSNPEAAMKFLNWQYQDIENHITMRYGLQGKSWKWSDDKKFNLDLLDKGQNYIGEFVFSNGIPNERKYASNDPLLKKHADYLNKESLKLDTVKMTVDVGVVYDPKLKKDKVPTAADIDRLRNEEVAKFIMGARPLSEYEQFLQELKKAGLDALIDFQTEQYKLQKK